MTATELFSALSAPKEENHIGSYQFFLSTQIMPALEAANLPIALEWAARHPATPDAAFRVERFIVMIFVKAWSHLGDKSIADAFALAAIPRLKARHSLISLVGFDNESERLKQLFNNDHERRRALALASLSRISDDDDSAVTLLFSHLVRTPDVPWLLKELRSAAPANQSILARVIKFAFDPCDPTQFEINYEEEQRIDNLKRK